MENRMSIDTFIEPKNLSDVDFLEKYKITDFRDSKQEIINIVTFIFQPMITEYRSLEPELTLLQYWACEDFCMKYLMHSHIEFLKDEDLVTLMNTYLNKSGFTFKLYVGNDTLYAQSTEYNILKKLDIGTTYCADVIDSNLHEDVDSDEDVII